MTRHHDHLIDTHFAQDAQTAEKQRLSRNFNRPLCAAAQSRALSSGKQHCTNAQSPGLAVAGLAAEPFCHCRFSIISSSSGLIIHARRPNSASLLWLAVE
jgi:hypothetical protein